MFEGGMWIQTVVSSCFHEVNIALSFISETGNFMRDFQLKIAQIHQTFVYEYQSCVMFKALTNGFKCN